MDSSGSEQENSVYLILFTIFEFTTTLNPAACGILA
jgi:hypothetical protein